MTLPEIYTQLRERTTIAPVQEPVTASPRAVILAGGRGTRLAPYTSVLPKPLMPVGERAILELVVDQLAEHGISDVTFCVGYLSHLIRAVFDNRENGDVNISYVQEQEALGTAGPLRLVDGLDDTFIVMNGDVLTTLDYEDLLRFHREQGNALTIATHDRRIKIDYGVLHLGTEATGGRIAGYEEKPEVVSTVSMGIYVLEPWVLDYVPGDGHFDVPDLVQALLLDGQPLGAYRFDGLWFDIGRKEDYEQAVAEWFAQLQEHGKRNGNRRVTAPANGNSVVALPGNGNGNVHAHVHHANGNGNGAHGPVGAGHANGAHDDGDGVRSDLGNETARLAVAAAVAATRADNPEGTTLAADSPSPPTRAVQAVMPDNLRETLSRVPTAVTIVTSSAGGRHHATTVSAFSSLSAEPPLVMVALDNSSELLEMIRESRRFVVNLLAHDQEELGRLCARKGADKLAGIPWTEVDGMPRIDGAAAWMTCEVQDLLPGGDHVIVVGLVADCAPEEEAAPLVYHRRRFSKIADE